MYTYLGIQTCKFGLVWFYGV